MTTINVKKFSFSNWVFRLKIRTNWMGLRDTKRKKILYHLLQILSFSVKAVETLSLVKKLSITFELLSCWPCARLSPRCFLRHIVPLSPVWLPLDRLHLMASEKSMNRATNCSQTILDFLPLTIFCQLLETPINLFWGIATLSSSGLWHGH